MQDKPLNAPRECLENMAKLKCLGTTVAGQNCIHEEIKSKFRKIVPPCS
jgi:hypothetical protein